MAIVTTHVKKTVAEVVHLVNSVLLLVLELSQVLLPLILQDVIVEIESLLFQVGQLVVNILFDLQFPLEAHSHLLLEFVLALSV